MITIVRRFRGTRGLVFGLALACACSRDKPTAAEMVARPATTFASAEEAADSLVAATGRFDVAALIGMLGEAGRPLVASEDEVLDRERAMSFAAEARTAKRLEFDSTGHVAILSVGAGDWPLPIPIVEKNGKWSFDAVAGAHEVLLRRIGENELSAIAVARGYVRAQQSYSEVRQPGATINQYAQRIVSTPGKRDGLAWQASDGSWEGPVGKVVADAIAEGYSDKQEPFKGYYFKVLKGQGPHARNGEVDFVVRGAMIGGFGLVAAPAEYEVTGVKSFIVNQDGVVYEKDLGPGSLDAFKAMDRFDPDSSWDPVTAD